MTQAITLSHRRNRWFIASYHLLAGLKSSLAAVVLALFMTMVTASAAAPGGREDAPDLALATRLSNQADQYYEAGRYAKAEPLYRRVLAIREKVLGPDHPDVATTLHDLALLYGATDRPAEAEPLYRRVLVIEEKGLGPEHPDLATTLYNLADLYETTGRYAEAEPLYRRALAIEEKALGLDHPDLATTLYSLAGLYETTGRYAEAEPLYRRALVIEEKALGPNHPDLATTLNSLADLYATIGRYGEAEPLYRRALSIREKALGPKHPDVANSLNNLAGLYDTTGRYAEAVSLSRRALAIEEKALGPEHPDVATALTNLAGMYRPAEAEPLYRRALAIREKALGPKHPDVANSLNNLAHMYYTTGRPAEAVSLFQRALALQEKALGPDHPDVATTLTNLAALYNTTGRYAEAEPLYRWALALQEKALGPEHPDLALSLNNLAFLYHNTGRLAEAEPLYRRALAIREKALGLAHRAVAESLNGLAVLYHNTGRLAEAEPLYRRALAIWEKALGPEHPAVATSLNNLAFLYCTTGRTAEAEPLYRRALALQEKALGPEHPDLVHSLNNLVYLYQTNGRTTEAEPLSLRALRIAQRAGLPDWLWMVQYGYAQLLWATARPDAAIFFGKQAVNTLQGLRANVPQLDKHQRAFMTRAEHVYRNVAAWLADAGRLPEAQRVLDLLKEEEYFKYVRRDPSTTGVGGLLAFTAAETPPAERYRAAGADLTRLAAERDALQALATRTADQDARLAQLDQQSNAAAQAFDRTLQDILTALAATRRDKVEPIQEAEGLTSDLEELGTGTVAIYTVVGEKRLYLLLITPTLRRAYPVEVSEAEINRAALAFRQALGDPHLDPRPAAQPFYRWLIQPLEPDLKASGAQTLLWSLDGSLRYLPVAALHDGQQYLAERYAQLVFTPASHTRLKDAPQAAWQGLGLGVTQAKTDFPALPAVRAELTAIIRDPDPGPGLLPGKLLFDDAFTLDALLRELQQRRPLVHISSHFRFTPGNDSQSYLLLGNGTLSLDRIQAEKTLFAGVDLLTLSACETAMGDAPNATGTEVEGFAVLAQRKGAKAVLATLWSVADASTGLFMQRFYALRQSERLTKAEALRRAQVELLHGSTAGSANPDTTLATASPTKGFTPDESTGTTATAAPLYTPLPGAPYAHPYYWAPFILLGNGL